MSSPAAELCPLCYRCNTHFTSDHFKTVCTRSGKPIPPLRSAQNLDFETVLIRSEAARVATNTVLVHMTHYCMYRCVENSSTRYVLTQHLVIFGVVAGECWQRHTNRSKAVWLTMAILVLWKKIVEQFLFPRLSPPGDRWCDVTGFAPADKCLKLLLLTPISYNNQKKKKTEKKKVLAVYRRPVSLTSEMLLRKLISTSSAVTETTI